MRDREITLAWSVVGLAVMLGSVTLGLVAGFGGGVALGEASALSHYLALAPATATAGLPGHHAPGLARGPAPGLTQDRSDRPLANQQGRHLGGQMGDQPAAAEAPAPAPAPGRPDADRQAGRDPAAPGASGGPPGMAEHRLAAATATASLGEGTSAGSSQGISTGNGIGTGGIWRAGWPPRPPAGARVAGIASFGSIRD